VPLLAGWVHDDRTAVDDLIIAIEALAGIAKANKKARVELVEDHQIIRRLLGNRHRPGARPRPGSKPGLDTHVSFPFTCSVERGGVGHPGLVRFGTEPVAHSAFVLIDAVCPARPARGPGRPGPTGPARRRAASADALMRPRRARSSTPRTLSACTCSTRPT